MHTAHSRGLSDLDPKAEPPDGAFEHKASGGSYRVYRQGNEFRHEEVLRSAEGTDITVPRSNIDEMRVIPQSIMPEGLLGGMSDQQGRDLFAYLRSTQPLND